MANNHPRINHEFTLTDPRNAGAGGAVATMHHALLIPQAHEDRPANQAFMQIHNAGGVAIDSETFLGAGEVDDNGAIILPTGLNLSAAAEAGELAVVANRLRRQYTDEANAAHDDLLPFAPSPDHWRVAVAAGETTGEPDYSSGAGAGQIADLHSFLAAPVVVITVRAALAAGQSATGFITYATRRA